MAKPLKHFRARSLVPGHVIGKTGWYVAVPGKGYKDSRIEVEWQGVKMIIENWMHAEAYRRFPDKWGRGTYTLGYFPWSEDDP